MDPYTCYSPSSSSSSELLTNPQKTKRPTPSSSLHSVRKPPAKTSKKPKAPLPPPPRVYRVDAINFRQVVQKLTGAPEFQSRRLQSVAPPPLKLVLPPISGSNILAPLQRFCSPVKSPLSSVYKELMSDTLETKPGKLSDASMATSPFGFNMSPSWYTWCSFPLLSPGTLASLEQGTVL
ncbi:hypothetical protein HHK36_009743 [Tetracentron sinense]|uniref:VQ domain-containing protein n=1 Tax=Tetracentron sinense TaxID=13715 RepID=A0A835DHS4_TETSI|nr:hypothetical protein HHK36_009743 [Tetracentron sinense]